MLSAVLSKETCAGCRFCCSFRRKSLWETPLLSEEFMRTHTTSFDGETIAYKVYAKTAKTGDGSVAEPEGRFCASPGDGSAAQATEPSHVFAPGLYGQTDLTGLYKTDDPEEEVACPFLDPNTGCTLPEDEKPFDCKIWPLRFMRMPDESLKVCLTPTCPAINKVDISVMKDLVRDGLGSKIREYAEGHPYMIKDYVEGFVVLE